MRLKKFFAEKSGENSDNDKTAEENLDFNSEQNISRPMTRALRKLIEHKNAAQLAINVLCDLSKKHCAMCEWEQECSDNLLLFNPNFAHQYIKERQSWLINKQSMCAKCKLQLGEHLMDNQAQNKAPSSNSIHQQCHHFNQQAQNDNTNDTQSDFPFQEFNSKELINLQNALRNEHSAGAQNLINAQKLINTTENEISLINEKLSEPLLHIANKLLGRQNLNFDQLTTPEQKLWNLFEKSDIYEFLTGETDTTPEFCHNWITCSAKPKVEFDFQTFFNDWNQLHFQFYTQAQPSTPATPVQHFL